MVMTFREDPTTGVFLGILLNLEIAVFRSIYGLLEWF